MSEYDIEYLKGMIRDREEECSINRDDWQFYIPPECLKDIHNDLGTPESIHGFDYVVDTLIAAPKFLPKDVADIPFRTTTTPTEHHLRQFLNHLGIEERQSKNPFFNERKHRYTVKPFIEVRNQHRKLAQDTIQRYGLRDLRPGIGEYSQDDRQIFERNTFGFQQALTDKAMDAGIQSPGRDHVERQLAGYITNFLDTVQTRPVYGERKRTFRMPYPVLDWTHREKVRCGTHYTYYGGILLEAVESQVKVLETLTGDGKMMGGMG